MSPVKESPLKTGDLFVAAKSMSKEDGEKKDLPVVSLGEGGVEGATPPSTGLGFDPKVAGETLGGGCSKEKRITRLEARRNKTLRATMKQDNEVPRGGCLACRGATCTWEPPYNIDVIVNREEEVEREIDYIRTIPEGEHFIECHHAGSVKRGGNPRMTRKDALEVGRLVHHEVEEGRRKRRSL